MSAILRLIMWS